MSTLVTVVCFPFFLSDQVSSSAACCQPGIVPPPGSHREWVDSGPPAEGGCVVPLSAAWEKSAEESKSPCTV